MDEERRERREFGGCVCAYIACVRAGLLGFPVLMSTEMSRSGFAMMPLYSFRCSVSSLHAYFKVRKVAS